MKSKIFSKKAIVIKIMLIIGSINFCYSQTTNKHVIVIETSDKFKAEMNKYFSSNLDLFVDETKQTRIVFNFRIDSLGNVASCHIVSCQDQNIKYDRVYEICTYFEEHFVFPNLFNAFHDYNERYEQVRYPFVFVPSK